MALGLATTATATNPQNLLDQPQALPAQALPPQALTPMNERHRRIDEELDDFGRRSKRKEVTQLHIRKRIVEPSKSQGPYIGP